MSEGKWVEAKHGDIRKGDVVRVTEKNGPQTVIVEGVVTRHVKEGSGEYATVWSIEDFENYYDYEFVAGEDGNCSKLERFVPAFVWPTKLGAVVTGTDEGETVTAVLVYEPRNPAEGYVWWTVEWGAVSPSDVSGLQDLTVVSEGATVEP